MMPFWYEEQSLFLAGEQVTNFDEDVDNSPKNDLALNVDHVFEADECDAFDSDVDEGPTTQTMFMANLTSEDPIYDEAGPSYDSILPLSNIIPYDQYVEDNEEHVVQSNVSSVRDDALMSILDEMHEQGVQSRLANKPNMVVKDSVTSKLARYKEPGLKEKVEDRLYKQDQSVQTVHMICKPKSFYDEKNKVAIGYKNPLCLTRAKQVQPALYNGHVLVMSNHARPVVHDSEDTRLPPPDYSKENLLATFAPQRNLTPEQIFWSIDDNNRKKADTLAPKPISTLTVYPPNTPVKLVPRILPTKSQVKINLYVLTQLFTEFDKTCKKRITPTGVTEGERGFEQTKRCYLTEVIPFFKTLKEHFVGVQKALFKEVKETLYGVQKALVKEVKELEEIFNQ
ncbi:hypothetical protein Tco_0359190 [Tanacetum coccineum]